MRTEGFRRDLAAEAAKHADDETTPEERIRMSLELGELCLDVYLATLPAGTGREEARRLAEKAKAHGRRTSRRAT